MRNHATRGVSVGGIVEGTIGLLAGIDSLAIPGLVGPGKIEGNSQRKTCWLMTTEDPSAYSHREALV